MYSLSKKIDNVLEDVLSLDKSQFKIKLIKSLNKNDAAYEHVLNRLNRSPSIDLISVDRIVTEPVSYTHLDVYKRQPLYI